MASARASPCEWRATRFAKNHARYFAASGIRTVAMNASICGRSTTKRSAGIGTKNDASAFSVCKRTKYSTHFAPFSSVKSASHENAAYSPILSSRKLSGRFV